MAILEIIYLFLLLCKDPSLVDIPSVIIHSPQTILIETPQNFAPKPYYSALQPHEGVNCIWIVDKKTNCIAAFSWVDQSPKVKWEFSDLQIGDVRTFFIHRPDSVLLYTQNRDFGRQLFWFNPATQVVNKIDYTGQIDWPDPSRDSIQARWETVYAPSAAPIAYIDNEIIAGILAYFPLHKTPDHTKPLFFALRGNGMAMNRLPIAHPDTYRKDKTTVDHAAFYLIHKGDSMITTFAGSPEVLIWNRKTSSLDTVQLTVPGIELSFPPPTDSAFTPVQQLLRHGYYGRLFYHETLRLFLRIVYLPTALMDPTTGLYLPFESRKVCLFAWDEAFVPQQFMMLSPGSDDRNAFCTPTGFAILSPNATLSVGDYHKLHYNHYEISR